MLRGALLYIPRQLSVGFSALLPVHVSLWSWACWRALVCRYVAFSSVVTSSLEVRSLSPIHMGGLQALIAVSWAYGTTSLSAVRAFLHIGIWEGLSGKINKSGIVIYFVGLVPLNNKSPRALYNWLFLNAFKQRSSLFCQFLQLPWGMLASLLWDSPSWPISENFNVYFNGWLL